MHIYNRSDDNLNLNIAIWWECQCNNYTYIREVIHDELTVAHIIKKNIFYIIIFNYIILSLVDSFSFKEI